MKRDYYEVLGVAPRRRRPADQEGVPQARARVPSRRQPRRPRGRGAASRSSPRPTRCSHDADSRAAYDRYGFDGLKGRPMTDFSHFGFSRPVRRLLRRRHVRLGAARRRRRRAPGARRRRRAGAARRRRRGDGRDRRSSRPRFGVTKEVEIEADVVCGACEGSGAEPGTGREPCPQCHGSGRMREVSSLGGFGQFIRTSTCSVCRGQGTIVQQPCTTCLGTGQRRAHAQRQGRGPGRYRRRPAHARQRRGRRRRPRAARPGDLYVQVAVDPDERFVRDGDDLIYRLDLTMVDAALGITTVVPALDGDIELQAAARAPSPATSRSFRNRGVPVLQGYGRGDLKVSSTSPCRATSTTSSASCCSASRSSPPTRTTEPDEGFLDKLRAAFRQRAGERRVVQRCTLVVRRRRLRPGGRGPARPGARGWQEERQRRPERRSAAGGEAEAGRCGSRSGWRPRSLRRAPPRWRGWRDSATCAATPETDRLERRLEAVPPPGRRRRLTVRAPWHEPAPGTLDVVVDVGMAFGTGAHPTTRGCVWRRWRSSSAARCSTWAPAVVCWPWRRCDWGSRRSWACDNDPEAVAAARDNARRNGLELDVFLADCPDPGVELPAPTSWSPTCCSSRSWRSASATRRRPRRRRPPARDRAQRPARRAGGGGGGRLRRLQRRRASTIDGEWATSTSSRPQPDGPRARGLRRLQGEPGRQPRRARGAARPPATRSSTTRRQADLSRGDDLCGDRRGGAQVAPAGAAPGRLGPAGAGRRLRRRSAPASSSQHRA